MISSVAPEVIGGGVEKCKGNLACILLTVLDSVLTSSIHPVVFEGLHVWTAFVLFSHKLWYWSPSGRTSDFIYVSYYFPFSERQLPPLSKKSLSSVDVTQGHHCLSQRKQPAALGHAKSPNSLLTCHEMGCHLLLDWDVQIQLELFLELPVLWSYWQQCLLTACSCQNLSQQQLLALWWLWGWELPTVLALGYESSCVVSD